jgi:serine/threonine protein kinase
VSTFTSEPGTRLGGRYRLEDRVAAAGGWAAWKAIDETLARPVTVLTFAPGFPQLREVVTAARAASRLNDSRFAQVFDVEDDWDHAYIVMEWAAGDTLDDMLAAGPLEAERGARIIAEAAEAISAAHAAGLAHLCLGPDSLRWTAGGGVKITGLGIDAALSAATAEDPAHADTRRLGMLLYAALTGHWPGPDSPTLPPAPLADGLPRSPRQVRAGVPAVLDEITSQVLLLRDRDGGPGLTTPAQLSTALMAAVPPVPIPQPPPSPRTRADTHRPSARTAREPEYRSPDEPDPGYWSPDGQPALRGTRARPPSPGQAAGASRVIVIAVVAALVAAGLAFAAYRSLRGGSSTPQGSSTHHSTAPRTGGAAVLLTPVSAEGFNENRQDASYAIDNDPSTFWSTSWYLDNPVFGGLKLGSGLMIDMGRTVRLSSVQVTFGSTPGVDVEIRIGNSNAQSPAGDTAPDHNALGQQTADNMQMVASKTNVSGSVTFTINSTATGQYVLIWLTKLPPWAGHAGKYQARIYNVVVRGSPA